MPRLAVEHARAEHTSHASANITAAFAQRVLPLVLGASGGEIHVRVRNLARLVLGRQHSVWTTGVVRRKDGRSRRRHVLMRAVGLRGGDGGGGRSRNCLYRLVIVVLGLDRDGTRGPWRLVCVIGLNVVMGML